jgi:ATP-dependent helicase/nuclease subunit B
MRFGIKERMARPAPPSLRVFTVPAGRPFLAALADALLTGNLPAPGGVRPDPLALADVTLYLPSRRATRTLHEAFLAASGGRALLLPKIRTVHEGGDDFALAAGLQNGDGAGDEIRPAIGDVERDLALTRLVLAWSEATARGGGSAGRELEKFAGTGARTPAQALSLARELARLMDTVEIEGVSLEKLGTLVPEAFSGHWHATLEFLKIITDNWPRHLAELGVMSPMDRANRVMAAEAARLEAAAPPAPVIVAGVTGTVPAAMRLMKAVARLPNGALVLPPVDQTLDQESWEEIAKHPEHPQFGLKKLLDGLGVARSDVQPLPGHASTPAQRARWTLVCEAMRPAGTTERWHTFIAERDRKEMARALDGVSVLEAPSAEDEAEAIALILREVAETPGRTAALISPDRLLARRVTARLEAWQLRVDDSAGRPFGKTVVGAYLDLVIEAAALRFEPVALMTLLKHPLCRLGWPAGKLAHAARALEVAALRGPYFGRGLDGLEAALEAAETARARHRPGRLVARHGRDLAHRLVADLQAAFAPLEEVFAAGGRQPLPSFVRAHAATAQRLAATSAGDGGAGLWQGEAGEWVGRFLAGVLEPSQTDPPRLRAADYPDFYRGLVAETDIRAGGATHPRLFIWGPLEARLQQPDVVVLGSLNEGTWPQNADPGPWLNRPMRETLGLPAPEERIGHAAHDFTSLLGAERVYLTRAAKIDGVPTVPSRWLLRLQALLRGVGHEPAAAAPWLAWAQARNDIAGKPRPVRAPEPRPPLTLRPRQLSVTTVEKWIANPYAIFARYILNLEPLPALGQQPDAALRGQIVHEALSRFAQAFPERLPNEPARELMAIAQRVLADYTGNARIAAFWAPRFTRFAGWFAETEGERRQDVARVLAEVDGSAVLAAPAGPFTLTARADRIDVGSMGLTITDYKTVANLAPLAQRALKGSAPQLALEAAIAAGGGFAGVEAKKVQALRYISASGGEPPGRDMTLETDDIAALAKQAEDGLARLIAHFDVEATPYRALRRSGFRYDYDEYAHLARVAEWSVETPEDA